MTSLVPHFTQPARILMLIQSAIMLGGLAVKVFIIINASGTDWEITVLPPVSLFTLASAIFPLSLALAFSRDIRRIRGLTVAIECVVGGYSLIVTLNQLNVVMLLNLILAAVIVFLVVRRPEGNMTGPIR